MKGIVVIGHGSRSEDAKNVFFRIVDDLKFKTSVEIEGCFMELSDPDIPCAIENMYKRGVRDFTILPYFLFNGMHIKKDIPEILQEVKEKYEDVTISMSNPIGYHPLLVDILYERMDGDKKCI